MLVVSQNFLTIFHTQASIAAIQLHLFHRIALEFLAKSSYQTHEAVMQSRLESLVAQMHAGGILYREAVSEFQRAFICAALRENTGNLSKAASALGLHRNTLSRICYEFQIDARSFRPGRRQPSKSAPGVSIIRHSVC